MIIDHATDEGRCRNREDTAYYFSDFLDGHKTKHPLRYRCCIPSVSFYDPFFSNDDYPTECYELERQTILNQFLDQIAGRFRITVSAYCEVCHEDWWTRINSISFSDKTDAMLFTTRFGK